MKYVLLCLLVGLSLKGFSQKPRKHIGPAYTYSIDTFKFVLPRDSVRLRGSDTGAIAAIDSCIKIWYVWDGKKWVKLFKNKE